MVWDARQAAPSLVLKAHARELLCADWCKYNDCIVATGSIDNSIKARSPETGAAAVGSHSRQACCAV